MHRIDARFQQVAKSHRTRLAVEDGSTRLSFGDLDRAAEAVALALSAQGLRSSEPVVVPVSNLAGDLAAFLGIGRAGGVTVPLHRAMPPAAAKAVLERLKARLLANPEGVPPEWMAGASEPLVEIAPGRPPERPLLSGAGTIVFTSGSTGEPKGVVLSAERQAAKLDMIGAEIGYEPGQSMLIGLQLTFSFGQWATWLTLLGGGTVHLRGRFEPRHVLGDLEAHGIARWPAVPTVMRRLLSDPDAMAGSGWSGVVMAGGEPLPSALGLQWLDAMPGTGLGDIFGLTETGTSDFFVQPEMYRMDAGTIGRAGRGIEWRLGTDGGLEIRSPYAMLGYLDDPERTASSVRDGYFETGDLAEADMSGRVKLIGRAKDLIVRAGNKISPLEVEAALLAEPGIAAALVAGVPDERSGEAVVAAVVPAPETTIDLDRLRDALTERIERYKVPGRFLVLGDLPAGSTGKADRGVLRRLAAGGDGKG